MNSEQLYSKDSPLYQALKELVIDAVREVLTERLYCHPLPSWWQPIDTFAGKEFKINEK